MLTCLYVTTLERVCGRPAPQRVRWAEHRPATGSTTVHELVVCPFHHDLTVAELVLDCTVDVIRVTPALEAVA
jgi:hypothetical protein